MKKDDMVSKEDLQSVESPPLSDALLRQMKPVSETHPETPPRVREHKG